MIVNQLYQTYISLLGPPQFPRNKRLLQFEYVFLGVDRFLYHILDMDRRQNNLFQETDLLLGEAFLGEPI